MEFEIELKKWKKNPKVCMISYFYKISKHKLKMAVKMLFANHDVIKTLSLKFKNMRLDFSDCVSVAST